MAARISAVAQDLPVSFVSLLGDNVYPSGVSSASDENFGLHFERVFSHKALQQVGLPVRRPPFLAERWTAAGRVGLSALCVCAAGGLFSRLGKPRLPGRSAGAGETLLRPVSPLRRARRRERWVGCRRGLEEAAVHAWADAAAGGRLSSRLCLGCGQNRACGGGCRMPGTSLAPSFARPPSTCRRQPPAFRTWRRSSNRQGKVKGKLTRLWGPRFQPGFLCVLQGKAKKKSAARGGCLQNLSSGDGGNAEGGASATDSLVVVNLHLDSNLWLGDEDPDGFGLLQWQFFRRALRAGERERPETRERNLKRHCREKAPRGALTSGDCGAAQTDADWLFVHLHHPLASAGNPSRLSPRLRDRLLPLLFQFKVDALFAGHEHLISLFEVRSFYRELPV